MLVSQRCGSPLSPAVAPCFGGAVVGLWGDLCFFFFAQRCSRISGVLGEGGGAAIEGCMGQMRQRIEK